MVVSDDCLRVIDGDKELTLTTVHIPVAELLREDAEAVKKGVLVLVPTFAVTKGDWSMDEVWHATDVWKRTVRPLTEVAELKGLNARTGRVYTSAKHNIPKLRVGKVTWVNKDTSWTKG